MTLVASWSGSCNDAAASSGDRPEGSRASAEHMCSCHLLRLGAADKHGEHEVPC